MDKFEVLAGLLLYYDKKLKRKIYFITSYEHDFVNLDKCHVGIEDPMIMLLQMTSLMELAMTLIIYCAPFVLALGLIISSDRSASIYP